MSWQSDDWEIEMISEKLRDETDNYLEKTKPICDDVFRNHVDRFGQDIVKVFMKLIAFLGSTSLTLVTYWEKTEQILVDTR